MTRVAALLSLVLAALAAVDAQPLAVAQAGRSPPPPHWKTWTSPPSNLDTPAPTATPKVAATTPSATARLSSGDSEIRPFPVSDSETTPPAPSASGGYTIANTTTPATTAPPATVPAATPSVPPTSAPPSNATTTETTETPSPSPLPSSSAPPAETPAPTAYVPPPVPIASADSPTFRLVAPVECDAKVAAAIEAIYLKNRALFDTCAADSAYQIFPFSGVKPTPTQIRALATSKACTVLFTACVVADLPECDATGISLKAVTETLLKVTEDVAHGKPAPDTERFHTLHIWRRDSNLAKAAGVPNGNDSALYAEFARDLPAALAQYSVELKGDLSIVHSGESAKEYSFGSASGEVRDVAGAVHANDGAEDDLGASVSSQRKPGDSNATNTAVKTLSGAPSSRLAGAFAAGVAALVMAATA